MTVDPHSDHHPPDHEDGQEQSDDPRVRAALELEARMRRALATKEDPLHDGESTSERLRRLEGRDGAGTADGAPAPS
jgi:hypothetical protein